MSKTTNICVFLGAAEGRNPVYRENAHLLGLEIAKQNCTLIYGGARNGLMGVLADAVLQGGSDVIGVMPSSLSSELQHTALTKLHVVNTMHERKALMSDLADAFIFFPGGLGTFEEVFEVWNAKKIGIHNKPLGFLNINGYYNALLSFLKECSTECFINEDHLQQVSIMEHPADLIKHSRKKTS
jgi:uncharacterized protein (TIGR00730 family)